MKKTSTPKLKMNLKSDYKLYPKKSTIDFIMGFAASFEQPKLMKGNTPGIVLN